MVERAELNISGIAQERANDNPDEYSSSFFPDYLRYLTEHQGYSISHMVLGENGTSFRRIILKSGNGRLGLIDFPSGSNPILKFRTEQEESMEHLLVHIQMGGWVGLDKIFDRMDIPKKGFSELPQSNPTFSR